MDDTANVSVTKGFPSCRLVLMVMGFFAFVNFFTLRVNLSVAIVAMVNSSYLREIDAATVVNISSSRHLNSSGLFDIHEPHVNYNSSNVDYDGNRRVFNWDERTQGIVLGAFFYGFVTTQIVSGLVAKWVGGRLLILVGLSWMAVLTLLTPLLTTVGNFAALFVIRLLEGIGGGVMYPAMVLLLSKWAAPLERSRMSTFVYAGSHIGILVGMQGSGILCKRYGWESAFYVFGVSGVMFSLFWFFLVFSSPATHPRISAEERNYIEKALSTSVDEKGTVRVPWLSLAKSLPFYALAVANFTFDWSFHTLVSTMPQYFKHILHFDIRSNGLLSGAPYLLMWIVTVGSGLLADWVRKRKILSTTTVRKLANGLGSMLPAACLIATGYVGGNVSLAVGLITAAIGLSGISYACWAVNHLDLAPQYAETLIGLTNTFGSLTGFMAPAVVGTITNRNETVEAWRTVFYISAAVYTFGTIFYGLFGSGEIQPWAMPKNKNNTKLQLFVDKDKEKYEEEMGIPRVA